MKKLICVKKKHIRMGLKRSPESCPIALALKDERIFDRPFVGETEVCNIVFPHLQYKLSRSARRFIKSFDTKRKVKPFNFILNFNEKEFV